MVSENGYFSEVNESEITTFSPINNETTNSLDRNLKGCTKAGISIKVKKKNNKLIKRKKDHNYTKKDFSKKSTKKIMKSEISLPADNSDTPTTNNRSSKSLTRKPEKKEKKTDCELKEEDDYSYKPENHKFITLIETFDVDKLNYIIEHFEEFKLQLRWRERYDRNPPLAQLIKYRDASVNGKIAIKYYQKNGVGRFQALSASLQGIPREIRHTISREFYQDLDMVNCHPVILQWMCRKQGFDSEYLDKYIAKREFYLKKIMRKNKISRDKAKLVYLAITNGGEGDYRGLEYKSSHLQSYKEEMTGLHKLFSDLNPRRFERVKAKRIKDKKDYNHEAALMNCLMLDTENDILMAMYDFFDNPKNAVLCFDGIMLSKNGEYDLSGCEKYILDKIGIEINLKIKPMDEDLDLSKCKIEKYEKVKIYNFSKSDDNLAECFCKLYGHEFMYVYDDKEGFTGYFYFFNGIYWVRDLQNRLISNRLGNELYLKLHNMLSIVINETENSLARVSLSKVQGNLICLQSTAKKESIIKALKRILYKNVELDANLKIIVFKNGVYDFERFAFRNTEPHEYITDSLSTEYDFDKPDEKEFIKFKGDYIDKVLINPKKDKDIFLKLLSSSLTGIRVKKFIIANGGGNNAKSGFFALLKATLGGYAYKISAKEFCQGKKDGFTLNNIHKKRLVYAEEPDHETQILDGSFIKDITGGDCTCFRKIHTASTDVDIHALSCILCNCKPAIKPFDDAAKERVFDYPFLSTFTNYDINNKNRFKGDQYYDSSEFRIANRLNLFHYLLPHLRQFFKDKQVITLSKNLEKRRDEYLLISDHFYKWFVETYEILDHLDESVIKIFDKYKKGELYTGLSKKEKKEMTCKTFCDLDYIGMKQLYTEFRQSEFYRNLSKKDKREMTYKAFRDRMLSKKPIRKIYREDHRPYMDGKQKHIRNSLIGIKLREEDIEDDSDSDSDVDMLE